MLKWYKNLYVGDTAKKKIDRIIWKVNHGAGMLDVYLITLPMSEHNQLEIISSSQLLQKPLRRLCPMIVGVACGYGEALDIVFQMTQEVYAATNTANIRAYLEQKIN